jgi:hypothetical protein
MKTLARYSHIMLIVGFIATIIGAIDPLEGSVVILGGSFIVSLSALISKSRRQTIIYTSFALLVIGIGLLFGLSSIGGIGGDRGRSYWWTLILLPYPAGWILGIVGAIQMMKDTRRTVSGH